MVETLELLIRRSSDHPRQPRAAMFRELLKSETYLLHVGEPLREEEDVRVTRTPESFDLWAEADAESGGVWVPLFGARDSVASYVKTRSLEAPEGREFHWMGHEPGQVFKILRGIECFSGVMLFQDARCSVRLNYNDVRALSEGRVPADIPEVYDPPVKGLEIPGNVKLAFGRVKLPDGEEGELLCVPEAGRFSADDARKLVRWKAKGRSAWIACRHFLQILKMMRGALRAEWGQYLEDRLQALIGFQMYGEAEALCRWLEERGQQAYAWVSLAAILGKTGRLQACADLCLLGLGKYPREKAFAINGAHALKALGRAPDAKKLVEAALKTFPGDPGLLGLRQGLA